MEGKFKSFIRRNKLEAKPFQTECFKWCSEIEAQAVQAEAVQAQAVQAEAVQAQQDQAQQDQAQQDQAQQDQAETAKAQQGQRQVKGGGIIALEPGLGKTIIMLGLVKCNVKRHTLIVLPCALLDQWEKCIITYCGCKPLVYHGSRPKNMKMTLAEVKAASQIIITTYGQISLPSVKQMNKGRKISLLHDISWNRIIYDEAHHVSHKNTNEYKGALVISSEIYWLVTGTPIQNNEKELYNLYSLFGLTNSKVYYDTGNNYIDTVKERVFYGTKAGVGLVLPALHEHVNHIEWETEREREFAWHIHSLLLFCHVPQKPPAAYIEAETENVNALRMKYLSRAQQVCAYPPMLNRAITHYEALLHRIQGEEALDEADVGVPLSKINAVLKTIMERKDNGCGKIVFCHYYDEIDAFAARLEPTLRVAKFDGRVPNSKRADILSQPVDVLLAQIKMCREGLNLQEHYSEVYFPSPHFNPATEQQAIARCWRMGQQKEVHVFRYLLGGTPPHPPSISGGLPSQPLTMDTFATQLHMKKQEFVNRMAAASAPLFV